PLQPRSHPAHPHLPSFPTRRSSDLTTMTPLPTRGVIVKPMLPTHDAAVQMIDTSIVRVHQHAACIARDRRQSMGRSRGWVEQQEDRKSTRLNSSHRTISYAVFCLKK